MTKTNNLFPKAELLKKESREEIRLCGSFFEEF